jgi:uncharacterized protein (DUF1800 family)
MSTQPLPSMAGFNSYPTAQTDAQAARFLQQAQFSSTTAEIQALKTAGSYAQFLQAQFKAPATQSGWDWLEERGYGEPNKHQYYFQLYQADAMVWKQLFTSQDAVRKRMALALSEFFVASMQSAEFDWRSHGYAHWWDTLVRHAFGNFRQLLEDVTLHPVMGYYLNTKGNQKEDPDTGRVPDENYAREIMQLFSIGLYMLNPDGTEKRDAQGQKIESYVQADVSNLARVFTGYDFDSRPSETAPVHRTNGAGLESFRIKSKDFTARPMWLNDHKHSQLEAKFLGVTVPANTDGEKALKIALDTLFQHPNTGPFFGKQMIQRLVTSNPSPAYVARVAAAFNDNGAGVRGDLKAVWMAILLDDEARGPEGLQSKSFGKLREPMLRLVQWGRSFGIHSEAGSWKIFDLSDLTYGLGQSPLRAPSVFNYFRPGYVPPNTAMAAAKATAPEFQMVNESTVGVYVNFMQNAMRRGMFTPEPQRPESTYANYQPDVKARYTQELALAHNAQALVDHMHLVLCAGQLSAPLRALILDTLNKTPITDASDVDDKLDRICACALMMMASAEYLIQK